MPKCPGQDTAEVGPRGRLRRGLQEVRQPAGVLQGRVKRRCKGCGSTVFNERMDIGCLAWCPSAEQCAGPDMARALELIKQGKERGCPDVRIPGAPCVDETSDTAQKRRSGCSRPPQSLGAGGRGSSLRIYRPNGGKAGRR